MNRVIRKSQVFSNTEAAALLSNLFTAELISPSRCIWLVSPWISNVPILDNEANSFDPLREWGPRRIRLADVLATLGWYGSSVVIGTTSHRHNSDFLMQLQARAAEIGCADRIHVVIDTENRLHEKAITADDYAVVGSMNITWNGINVREEYIELRTDEEFVARARLDAMDRFGQF